MAQPVTTLLELLSIMPIVDGKLILPITTLLGLLSIAPTADNKYTMLYTSSAADTLVKLGWTFTCANNQIIFDLPKSTSTSTEYGPFQVFLNLKFQFTRDASKHSIVILRNKADHRIDAHPDHTMITTNLTGLQNKFIIAISYDKLEEFFKKYCQHILTLMNESYMLSYTELGTVYDSRLERTRTNARNIGHSSWTLVAEDDHLLVERVNSEPKTTIMGPFSIFLKDSSQVLSIGTHDMKLQVAEATHQFQASVLQTVILSRGQVINIDIEYDKLGQFFEKYYKHILLLLNDRGLADATRLRIGESRIMEAYYCHGTNQLANWTITWSIISCGDTLIIARKEASQL